LVNGSVDVPPGPGEFHVGLVDEPATAHAVTTWPVRLHQQRREPLDPSEVSPINDLSTSLMASTPGRAQCNRALQDHRNQRRELPAT
jgi:hypothetical protein